MTNTWPALAQLAVDLIAKGHLVTIIRTSDRSAPLVWHSDSMVGAAVDHVSAGNCVVTSDGRAWGLDGQPIEETAT
jgi:hypothetical protein